MHSLFFSTSFNIYMGYATDHPAGYWNREVDRFLQAGADPLKTDPHGMTALHMAAHEGSASRFLIAPVVHGGFV